MNKIAIVQALDRRQGAVFYLDIKYGQAKGAVAAGDLMIGARTGREASLSGRRYATSLVEDERIASGNGTATSFTGTLAYPPVRSESFKIPHAVRITDGVEVITDDGTGRLIGTGGRDAGTIVYSTGAFSVTFAVVPTKGVDILADYAYDYQRAAAGVPEVTVDLTSSMLEALDFPLRAFYTLGAAIDLERAHGLILEDEIVKYLGGEIRFEIDHYGIDLIHASSQTPEAADPAGTFDATVGSGQEWIWKRYQFIDLIEKGSNNIFAKTLRGFASFIICGNNVARIIRQLEPHFKPAADLGKGVPTGPIEIGSLDGRFVIQNPFLPTNRFVLGFKGESYLFAGMIYAPSERRLYQATDKENFVNCGDSSRILDYGYNWAKGKLLSNSVIMSEWSLSAAKLCVENFCLKGRIWGRSGTGSRVSSFLGKTYEEIYGEEKAREVKMKMSLKRKGKTYEELYGTEKAKDVKEYMSLRMKVKNSANIPGVRECLKLNHYDRTHSDRGEKISKAKLAKSTKRPDVVLKNKSNKMRMALSKNNPMKNADVFRRHIESCGRFPNKAERKLHEVLDNLFCGEFRLNLPDEQMVLIGHKHPDIISERLRLVVELFGEYWHGKGANGRTMSEERRVQHFAKYGWDCMVVWERELKNIETLKQKLMAFYARRFNDCNQSISCDEMVGQSDLYGDIKNSAEMTESLVNESNKNDIPLFATPTLITSDLKAQKGFLSAAGFKMVNPGLSELRKDYKKLGRVFLIKKDRQKVISDSNWVNCWEAKLREENANQQPSRVESRKVQRLLEEGTSSLITSSSAQPQLEQLDDDIVWSPAKAGSPILVS